MKEKTVSLGNIQIVTHWGEKKEACGAVLGQMDRFTLGHIAFEISTIQPHREVRPAIHGKICVESTNMNV